MFIVLAFILLLTLAVDVFVSTAVIYHIRKYTLAGWTLPRIVVPAYLAASLVMVILAIMALSQIASV